jgi:acetolactate synthase-1/2/3 large subunit
MNNPDFITLAKGYDIQGYRVTSLKQLQEVLPEIFNTNKPIIVACIIDELETV